MNYYCTYEMKSMNEMILDEDQSVTYVVRVERTPEYDERIQIEYQLKGIPAQFVEDDELRGRVEEVDGKKVAVKETTMSDGRLEYIRIHVLNMKERVETPLKIYVTEDFLIDGGIGSISETTILILLIVGIVVFCLFSLAGYVYYRRKLSEEFFEAITETDERYLVIFDLRKKIRKLERKAKDTLDNSELLIERKKLLAELEQLKEKQTEEFLSYLEFI